MARNLSELGVAVLMIDGVKFADHCCVVALAICGDGTKVPLGLFLGDSENKKVVRGLLADLVKRGLRADSGLLVVIDGSKALERAVRDVFGPAALIQRCTLHKRRNLAAHLPIDDQRWVDQRLARAFNHPDPSTGFAMAERSRPPDRYPLARRRLKCARGSLGHVHDQALKGLRPPRGEACVVRTPLSPTTPRLGRPPET